MKFTAAIRSLFSKKPWKSSQKPVETLPIRHEITFKRSPSQRQSRRSRSRDPSKRKIKDDYQNVLDLSQLFPRKNNLITDSTRVQRKRLANEILEIVEKKYRWLEENQNGKEKKVPLVVRQEIFAKTFGWPVEEQNLQVFDNVKQDAQDKELSDAVDQLREYEKEVKERNDILFSCTSTNL